MSHYGGLDLSARRTTGSTRPKVVSDERTAVQSDFSPVPLDVVRDYLRVQHTQDDTQLQDLTQSAADIFADRLNHHLRQQTRRVTFDRLKRRYRVPSIPVSSLDAVETVNEGTATSETLADWYLHPTEPKEIRLTSDGTTLQDEWQVIRFEYTAGYASQTDVPDDVQITLAKMVADMYEYRTSKGEGLNRQLTEQPMQWKELLRAHEAPYYGQPSD